MPRKQTVTTPTIDESPLRKGLPWSSNEINRLHNEYELKELTVHEIADLHSRGVSAILHRLADEGLIASSWLDARGWEFPVATEKKAPVKAASKKTVAKKASVSVKKASVSAKKADPSALNISIKIDDTHDYTASASDSSDSDSVSSDGTCESDEEYTLDDAKNDYDHYSMRDKVEFFRGIFNY